MPRVPETAERDYFWLKVSKSDHFISSRHLTRDDVHHEEEEGSADAPGVGWDNLHDDGEEDRKPGLREQIIQGWRK